MIILAKIHQKFDEIKIIQILNYMREIDTILKKNLVYEGQYGGKEKSIALLVKDLEI